VRALARSITLPSTTADLLSSPTGMCLASVS
jgi:hypothetical protein